MNGIISSCRFKLFTATSHYVTLHEKKCLGYGLFATRFIPKNSRIITFKGDILSVNQYNARVNAGEEPRGYSTIYLTRDSVLACYKYAMNGTCLASMVNTVRNAIHHETGERAKVNSKLVHTSVEAYIVSVKDIPTNCEIMMPYGNSYHMPK